MIIQHADRNVSHKEYNRPGCLRVMGKPFATLQGEGPYAGWPAVFVRLSGCDKGNKRSCQFCDTAFEFDAGEWWSFDGLGMAITAALDRGSVAAVGASVPCVVITGGEPTLQSNLGDFLVAFRQNTGFNGIIQIESNGLRPIMQKGVPHRHRPRDGSPLLFELVVSPKVSPNNQQYAGLSPKVTDQISYLKFVVSADPSSPYYDVPSWVGSPNNPLAWPWFRAVYVSPLTVYRRAVGAEELASMWDDSLIDRPATHANYERARALALHHNWRVTTQMHLLLDVA